MVYLCYIIVFQRASGVVQVEGKSSLFTTIENRKHNDYPCIFSISHHT
jgi:hypothetical protein